jgi:acetyl-CoA carboxylase carboxyltransferase component
MTHHGRFGWAVALTTLPAIALTIALSSPAAAQAVNTESAPVSSSTAEPDAQVALAKPEAAAKGVTSKALE